MNKSILLLSCGLFLMLCSCGRKQSPLIREWQAVTIEDALMTQLLKDQETFIDSMGRNTSAEQNMQLYFTTNIDSLRRDLRDSLVVYKEKQEARPSHIRYDFRTDSMVIMHSRAGTDSAAWYFEADNLLVLDPQKVSREGMLVRLQVLELNDSVLKVKNATGSNAITTTFRPATK